PDKTMHGGRDRGERSRADTPRRHAESGARHGGPDTGHAPLHDGPPDAGQMPLTPPRFVRWTAAPPRWSIRVVADAAVTTTIETTTNAIAGESLFFPGMVCFPDCGDMRTRNHRRGR